MRKDQPLVIPSPQAILVLDASGRIRHASRGAVLLLGWTEDDLRGRSLLSLATDPTQRRALRDSLKSGAEAQLICRLQRSDRTRLSAMITILKTGRSRICGLCPVPDQPASQESDFHRLYEEMRDAFVIVDMQGRIRAFNRAYQELTGYSRAELMKKTYRDLTPPEWLAVEDRIVRTQILPRGYSDLYEKEYIHKSGRRVPIELRTILSRDARGQPVAMWAIIRDVSERKRIEQQLRESEQRYRTLAETAQDMIVLIDRQGRLLYVNQFTAHMLARRLEQIIGRKYSLFLDRQSNRELGRYLEQAFQSAEVVTFEAPLKLPGGSAWFEIRLVALPAGEGKPYAVLGIARDITARKMVEDRLREAQRELEQRVRERTAALEAAEAQLRALNMQLIQAQEEERRRVSRELHDDAGSLLISLKYGLLSLLEEQPDGEEATTLRRRLAETLGIVDETIEHIRTLSHFLRPPALDVGGLHVSLQDLCHEFEEHTGLAARYHGQPVEGLSEEIAITLYRFAQEALTNVVKHARASRVEVRLRATPAAVTLSITDNGRGLKKEAAANGMGLLGMRERLGLLGGKVSLQSGKGRGTTVTARVPLPPRPATGESP